MNTHIDCDIIVSEVREKSRKPDEIYGIAERLSPGTRKIGTRPILWNEFFFLNY